MTPQQSQADAMSKAVAKAVAPARYEAKVPRAVETSFALGQQLNNSPFANRWQNPGIVIESNQEAHLLQQTFVDKSLNKHMARHDYYAA